MNDNTTQPEGALPALPANAPGRPARPRYREQHGIVLVCPGEAEQAKLYEALEAIRSCKIRVVVT